MKHHTRITVLIAGLLCFLIAGFAYAVCVTPKQLTEQAKNVTDSTKVPLNTILSEPDFVYKVFNGNGGTVPPLSAPAAQSLKATEPNFGTATTPILTTAVTNLTASSDWQAIPATADSATLKANLVKMQTWASYGELVIAIDSTSAPTHIAILVPGDLRAIPNPPTNPAWSPLGTDTNDPHIAYSLANGATISANERMSVLFIDPSKVAFFRYKN